MRQQAHYSIGTGSKFEELASWRRQRLLAAGFIEALATPLARQRAVDLHALLELVDAGCPPELAARILAPLEEERRRW